jgi:hypothetical protein
MEAFSFVKNETMNVNLKETDKYKSNNIDP